MMFKEGWIVVKGVPTHVLTWGGWIEDKIEGDSVFLCITGNPGLVEFYFTFLSTLQELIKMPVWIINLNGAEVPTDDKLKLPSIKRNPALYSLDGQVEHKYEFIKTYIPESKNIYLGGHSVGGKIVVELLKKDDIASRMSKSFLLFPTLENIADTRNGKFITRVIQHVLPTILFLAWIFTLFPKKMRLFMLCAYFRIVDKITADQTALTATYKLVQPKPLRGVFTLAFDEMDKIKELDLEVFNKLGDKIYCYYGQADGWAPVQHMENLRKVCPTVKAKVLDEKFKHAFVLYTPVECAHLISKEILPA